MAVHPPSRNKWRVMILPVFSALLSASLVLSSVYVWRWMQQPTSFPIQEIHVQGDTAHVSSDAIARVVKTQLTGGFFSLNLVTVRQAVLAFPWIKKVSFRRQWPNALSVDVTEYTPLARFGAKGVVTADGVVFYPDIKSISQDLPSFDAPTDQAEALADFYQTANPLAKLLDLSIISLRENAMHSWYLCLSNQILVKLGRQDPLLRFKRFVTIYPQILKSSKKTIASVDLRYPDGVAVQFKQSDAEA